ncbi:hypothetical protein V6N13_047248 [Hibiscus sabdariffa]|uniref:Uncharacterized protein n=1 Tax=Hibiscus sabdariffa TaxID=183260 RepID=A0ABR2F3J7_9ROSI
MRRRLNRCLNLNGKKRPTVKQVAMELERIRSSDEANAIEESGDEDSDIDITIEASSTVSYPTSSSITCNVIGIGSDLSVGSESAQLKPCSIM